MRYIQKDKKTTRYRLSLYPRKNMSGQYIFPLCFSQSMTVDSIKELGEMMVLQLSLGSNNPEKLQYLQKIADEAMAFCNGAPLPDNEDYFRDWRKNIIERHKPPFYKIEIIKP